MPYSWTQMLGVPCVPTQFLSIFFNPWKLSITGFGGTTKDVPIYCLSSIDLILFFAQVQLLTSVGGLPFLLLSPMSDPHFFFTFPLNDIWNFSFDTLAALTFGDLYLICYSLAVLPFIFPKNQVTSLLKVSQVTCPCHFDSNCDCQTPYASLWYILDSTCSPEKVCLSFFFFYNYTVTL